MQRLKLGSRITVGEFTGVVLSIAAAGVQLRGEGGEVKSFSLAEIEEALF